MPLRGVGPATEPDPDTTPPADRYNAGDTPEQTRERRDRALGLPARNTAYQAALVAERDRLRTDLTAAMDNIYRLKRENAALARESDVLADALDAVTHEWLQPFGDHGECAACRGYINSDVHRTPRAVLADLGGGTGPHKPRRQR